MYQFKRSSGIIIPRKYENEPFYWKVKEFLIRRTKKYNTSDYVVNSFFIESDKNLVIPRFFPLSDFVSCNIIDEQYEGKDIEIEHNIIPRTETQKKAIEYMLSNNNGILQLNPGVGKTVITIKMIAERKKKSLILVHRDSLADQWRERFLEFTNLKEDDISRLTSSTIRESLDKPVVIITDQTFISLLRRNRKYFLIELNKAKFGVFVADEVHTSVGAPTFSECSIHIPTKYIYGLSATPYRGDGNGDIINFHLGEIFSDDDVEGTVPAKIMVLMLDYKIDTPRRFKYIHWGGDFQRSRYLNMMKKSKLFLEVIKSLLDRFKNDKYHLLIVMERIKLIEDLYEWLDHKDKSKFIRNAKMDQLDSKFTFATPGKCRDGIDAPIKNCLIMTSPISNVEQMCGRVCRSFSGKENATIIDMVDTGCKRISSTLYNRLKFYEKKNWDIQYVAVLNNKLKVLNKDEALELIQ